MDYIGRFLSSCYFLFGGVQTTSNITGGDVACDAVSLRSFCSTEPHCDSAVTNLVRLTFNAVVATASGGVANGSVKIAGRFVQDCRRIGRCLSAG